MLETTLRQRMTVAAVTPWILGGAAALAGWALTTPRPPPGLPLLVVAVLSALGLVLLAERSAWARAALRLLTRWGLLTPVVGLTWTATSVLLRWLFVQPAPVAALLAEGLRHGAALTALGVLGQAGLAAWAAHAARGRWGRVAAPGDDRLPAALGGLRPDAPDVW